MNVRNSTQILALLLLSFFILPATAKVIDQATAEKAAKNYMYEKLSQKKGISYNEVIISTTYTINGNGIPVFYGINFRDGGFVLITADDIVKPIIGYSPEGSFAPESQPENFIAWMDGVKEQVMAYRHAGTQSNQQIRAQWSRLTDESFGQMPVDKSGKNVEPLVMSKWDQGKYFNTMCPADGGGPEGRALTGCVATAMSQIVYYYRYPTNPTGIHTYGTNGNPAPYGHYGTLSVNYNNHTYNFDQMVNEPTESNLEIAKLVYHCGVSVSMKYGPTASGAITQDCVGALTSHFRYSGSTSFSQRGSISNTMWHGLLLTEIDAKRPVLYSGRNSSYGHCFIADGYEIGTTDTLYHFNWGWSGSYDGFYDIDDLNPGNDPNGPFSDAQGMVKGIYPANSFPYQCSGQRVITASQGTIEDGSSYTANYTDNADCSWLIAPTDSVKKFTLSFNRFSTESGADIVKVYDGADTNAPLLLTHSGTTQPGTIMSTGNKMLITFHSDSDVTDEGWFATFKPIYPTYCSGTELTAPFGTVTDGSGSSHTYINNTTCSFVIQPPNPDNKTLILEFTEFETEPTYDYVRVYDLATQQQLGPTFSGTSLPPTLVSPSGQMYIEFKTNYVYNYAGWSANYSLGYIGIGEVNGFSEMKIYPNPANDHLNINFSIESSELLTIELLSLTGQSVVKESHSNFSGVFTKSLDLGAIARGIYTLRLTSDKGLFTQKVVVQ